MSRRSEEINADGAGGIRVAGLGYSASHPTLTSLPAKILKMTLLMQATLLPLVDQLVN